MNFVTIWPPLFRGTRFGKIHLFSSIYSSARSFPSMNVVTVRSNNFQPANGSIIVWPPPRCSRRKGKEFSRDTTEYPWPWSTNGPMMSCHGVILISKTLLLARDPIDSLVEECSLQVSEVHTSLEHDLFYQLFKSWHETVVKYFFYKYRLNGYGTLLQTNTIEIF